MTKEVAAAVEEIKANWPDAHATVREDGQGGAVVVLESVPMPPIYVQPDSWVGFHITFQYPYADVYPHFVRGDLARRDGRPLGDGITVCRFEDRPALQISRRSNHLNPALDTALIKLLKVLDWLGSRP